MSGHHRPPSQKHKFGKRRGKKQNRDDNIPYEQTKRENQIFEKFYKESGLIPENEWDEFMCKLRAPLPSTFRVTGCKSEASELLKIIKNDYLSKISGVEVEGRVINPPKCLSWYPNELAWQLDLDRKFIRKCDALKELHQFLIQETESGGISRQEAVSMIPPLVLDVQPHHKVFDMCAAPGSKTSQLIEMLHRDEEPVPEGVVIANDSDNKRCYLMVHQVKRLESPSFLVVNHDASIIPNFHINPSDKEKELLRFDRILADVPCSGDGTLRKNIDAWFKWNPSSPCHLHNLQSRILRRGLEMLEVGGRIVYSTCSMNPMEDEAVIANILTMAKGSVHLVDVSEMVPGLKYCKGISQWKVMSRELTWYSSFDEVPERLTTQIRPTLFPPKPEDAEAMCLHKCMRILPHMQDTGGFFVAVIEKTTELPWMSSKHENSDEVEEMAGDDQSIEEATEKEPPRKKQRRFGYKEDPFLFLEKNDPMWPQISEFFGVDNFPVDQLLVRCSEGKKRNVYFASPLVKTILQLNQDRFKFINLGLKIVARSESRYTNCDFRPVQDGIGTLFPYMSKRKVTAAKEDIVTILSSDNPFTNKLTKPTQSQVSALDQGGCVFVYEPDGSPDSPQCRLLVCGWIGKVSCRSFLARNDRGHYLRLCGAQLKTREEILAEKAKKASQSRSGDEDDLVEGQDLAEGTDLDESQELPSCEASLDADGENEIIESDEKCVQDHKGTEIQEKLGNDSEVTVETAPE